MAGNNSLEIDISTRVHSQWNKFVNQHRDSKIYHLAEWNEVVSRSFRHKTYYVSFRKNNRLEGILPLTLFKSPLFGKFAVSLPFVNYGGGLFSAEVHTSQIDSFLLAFRKQVNIGHIELRLDQKRECALPVKQHKVTFLLNLLPEEELWNYFKAKLRSQIKRPIKEKMYARAGGVELLDPFYSVFSRNMRDLGTPVYSKKFFQNILSTLPLNAFIVVVYTEDHLPVAASFLLKYRNTMEIPWASSLREYNRYSPNMLLYWESLRLSIRQGCRVFDFGRCTPGSGTYRFKKQWGAEEKKLYWYYALPDSSDLPDLSPSNPKFELLIKLWRKLPLPLTQIMGPAIIRNIPG